MRARVVKGSHPRATRGSNRDDSAGTLDLARQEILARWPAGEPPPCPDSLWRCLTRGCELGILVRTGAGNKAEAFRYGLARGEPGG